MIVDLKKYIIIGAKEDLDEFFYHAQERGFLEFISLSGKKTELPTDIQDLINALKILRKMPVKKQSIKGGSLEDAIHTAERVLSLKATIEKSHEEERLLQAEIARVYPFGDFSMEDLDDIEKRGKRKIQFFCMKTAKSHITDVPEEVIYINTEYDMDYFIAINPEPKTYPGMIEMRIDRPLGELQKQLSIVTDSLHQSEREIKDLADQMDFLHNALIERLNDHNLISAKKDASFPMEQSLFCIEAWVPKNKIAQLYGLIDGMAIHAEEVIIEKTDKIPTCMENKGLHKIGEDLVKIYDVPANKDKDPSGWVLGSFALFFAVIVADAGYGLIYLLIALLLKWKIKHPKAVAKRFINLLFLLSITCIVWGVMNAAYFGIELNPKSNVARFSLMHYMMVKKADYLLETKNEAYQEWVKKYPGIATATNGEEVLERTETVEKGKTVYEMEDKFWDNVLLEFAILIGVIHISISLARYLSRHWANLGWIIFAIGGFLFFPSMLHATSLVHYLGILKPEIATKVGLQLVYVGIGLAAVLAVIQKKWAGFGEVTHIMQVFADILSYLRLYALALASTIMAETFNGLGMNARLVVGLLIILIGHTINVGLAAQGGVIHGLRLNFIEWYHYSFEGGGRLFAPLKKLKPK